METLFYILFYIIVFLIFLTYILKPRQIYEDFLVNTIQLTSLTLDPIKYNTNGFSISQDFIDAIQRFIPMIQNESQPEIFSLPKSEMVKKYLDNPDKTRFVCSIYTVYLTIISHQDNMLYTSLDLKNSDHIIINILDKRLEPLMKTLYPKNRIRYIQPDSLKILERGNVYCSWETEYSSLTRSLHHSQNKFIILKMDSDMIDLDTIQLLYPTIILSKYNIMYQGSENTERVIYALKDSISLYTYSSVPDLRVYKFIETLFEQIEPIRVTPQNTGSKFALEFLRPENLIEISLIPYHPGVEQYFRKLEVITNKPDPICVNTITTIPCNPEILLDNRYRVILYGSND